MEALTMRNDDRAGPMGPVRHFFKKSRWPVGVVVGGLVALTACDTEVTNPGPVQDEFLNTAESQAAVVNGAKRGLAEALNWIAYTGAAISREVHPSGSTGSFGITTRQQVGELADDQVGAHWSNAQRARWLAESGIERIVALDAADQDRALLAEAYLWAGYSNRLLGENMCEAVIDGGSAQARSVYLDRALANFNSAAGLASGDMATAAVAGRAAVKLAMGDWSGAVTDARTISTGFTFAMDYFDIGDDVQANRVFNATKGEPYRAHTAWNTWVQDVGLSTMNPTGDPRVPFNITGEVGDAQVQCCGNVDWWPETKMDDDASPINLSSGAEMRLIEAEDALRGGQLGTAVTLINGLRAAAGVAEIAPANMTEAWTDLKRERAIVLWLEGRRLHDLGRWAAENTPGALHLALTGSRRQRTHRISRLSHRRDSESDPRSLLGNTGLAAAT